MQKLSGRLGEGKACLVCRYINKRFREEARNAKGFKGLAEAGHYVEYLLGPHQRLSSIRVHLRFGLVSSQPSLFIRDVFALHVRAYNYSLFFMDTTGWFLRAHKESFTFTYMSTSSFVYFELSTSLSLSVRHTLLSNQLFLFRGTAGCFLGAYT